jgi:2-dehydropantoate 2-reductase
VRLLVLGAGAVGGYFGGRLAEAGADVTFLVRPRRGDQIRRDGLRIESQLGNVSLPVKTVLADDLRPGFDLILLTCKAYDLDSAMDAIAPAMDDACAIVPLLNGITHVDRLDQRFGRARVMGGTCQVNATLRPDGVVEHGGVLQRLFFGERDRSKSPRALTLAGALANTKIDWKLSDDIEQDLWEKVMLLAALAATTCLFRANVREIIASPGGREVMERALAANIEIVTREGHPPRADVAAFARNALTNPSGAWSTSMLRDLEAGGPVEADHVIGWMLDKARQHGVDAAILSLAYLHLKAYEARRAAGRLQGR